MEKFIGTETDNSLKNHCTWVFPFYFLGSRLQINIAILPKWEPRSSVEVYLGHSPFHAGSVAMVLYLGTGHVSPQLHVGFDDEFSTFQLMREGTISPNWTDLV